MEGPFRNGGGGGGAFFFAAAAAAMEAILEDTEEEALLATEVAECCRWSIRGGQGEYDGVWYVEVSEV